MTRHKTLYGRSYDQIIFDECYGEKLRIYFEEDMRVVNELRSLDKEVEPELVKPKNQPYYRNLNPTKKNW